MYAGVPRTLPACVSEPGSDDRSVSIERVPGRRLGLLAAPDGAPRPQDLGQPPVHDLDLAELPDHDVRRLQVPVDDPLAVGVPDRLADLLEDGDEPAAVAADGSASRSASVSPLMSFMARNGRPSGQRADLVDGGMPGCWSWPVIWASSTNRRGRHRAACGTGPGGPSPPRPGSPPGRGPGRRPPSRRGRLRRGPRTQGRRCGGRCASRVHLVESGSLVDGRNLVGDEREGIFRFPRATWYVAQRSGYRAAGRPSRTSVREKQRKSIVLTVGLPSIAPNNPRARLVGQEERKSMGRAGRLSNMVGNQTHFPASPPL